MLDLYKMVKEKYVYKEGLLLHKQTMKTVYTNKDRYGYLTVQFKYEGKTYSRGLHRLVWIYHHGNIGKDIVLDHIDRDRLNNSIDNLRVVSLRDNAINRGIHSNNKSGFSGVHWLDNKQQWRARISISNGKRKEKCFKTKEDAINQRLIWEKEYYGDIKTNVG